MGKAATDVKVPGIIVGGRYAGKERGAEDLLASQRDVRREVERVLATCADRRIPSLPGTSGTIVDGAWALVEKIRVLEDRRTAAIQVSSARRRRLLHRMHEQAALAAEPARRRP